MAGTSKIEEWLEALPEEEIQRELDEFQAELTRISAEVNKRREILEMKKRWREFYGVKFGQDSTEPLTTNDEPPVTGDLTERPRSIRAAVLRVMATDPAKNEWAVQELREALVQREWMADTPKALRSLLSALSRMTSEEELERVRQGIYRTAVQEAALQVFSDQGGQPD